MIRFTTGNLLGADAEAIVNTVNTVGVMGKGIALQFKKKFPDNFKEYERAHRHGELQTGKMLVFVTGQAICPKYIINFPTKRHWKENTKLEYITEGLADLLRVIYEKKIHSIAIPPLGCGNGGLEWAKVRPIIEEYLSHLEGVEVLIYEPKGAPEPERQLVSDKLPAMTPGRAALLGLMEQYLIPGYRFTLLEVQKLAYLLQEAGQSLKLDFQKNKYGPYAKNLNHVLQHIDGHYINGYGDRTTESRLSLLEGASESAHKILDTDPDTRGRLDRVAALIEGFETPYGMELLSTVHWLAVHEIPNAISAQGAVTGFANWNDRKAQIFKPKHIEKAWSRLLEQGWLTNHQST